MPSKEKTAVKQINSNSAPELPEVAILKALDEYDRLYIKDWVRQHGLSRTAHEELLNMLVDGYFFIQSTIRKEK